ncbi:MAG: hypothetical protein LBQ65_00045, partial [Tannerellaceae bacterium]|nr:hypothetical protein [Tannerellaceae bacterium]
MAGIMKNRDTNVLFQNGSVWLQADFHLHTKADKEFAYPGAENDFVNDYVNKLVAQNIRLGVITNHNKFDKSEFVALKKKAYDKGVGLFPGLEFSLKEGIPILIVFDDAWYKGQTDYINQFLDAAFDGIELQETVKKLDAIGHHYFIMLAHVDARESSERVLAIEGIGEGQITYSKIGDFSFEALQYALSDHKNRLQLKDKPQINNSYIKSISFQGGLLNEQQIFFSPELNNLIGIRGSGKSSILEILRYALNIPFGSQTVDKEYKDDLIKHVLKSGGKVVLEIVNRQGETYKVERIYGQKEDIYKEGILQHGITLDAILQQPIYFGQ